MPLIIPSVVSQYWLVVTLALAQSVTINVNLNSNTAGANVAQPLFRSCNKEVCASRISACLLMESCKCKLPDCTCCVDCTRCLGDLWIDCCDCVGLCVRRDSMSLPFHRVSTVGDLEFSIPSLFEALSYGSNLPVVYVTLSVGSQPNVTASSAPEINNNVTIAQGSQDGVCKVAFFDDCRSLEQCEDSCGSMGAHRYRWFHNGCCQCVGETCTNYGVSKPLCKNCAQ